MDGPETIGQRVRRERLARGITQRDLAERVGVGAPHISKVEADRENPSDALLEEIATVFQVDVDELFLTARRLPPGVIERLAADPAKGARYLRRFGATRPSHG